MIQASTLLLGIFDGLSDAAGTSLPTSNDPHATNRQRKRPRSSGAPLDISEAKKEVTSTSREVPHKTRNPFTALLHLFDTVSSDALLPSSHSLSIHLSAALCSASPSWSDAVTRWTCAKAYCSLFQYDGGTVVATEVLECMLYHTTCSSEEEGGEGYSMMKLPSTPMDDCIKGDEEQAAADDIPKGDVDHGQCLELFAEVVATVGQHIPKGLWEKFTHRLVAYMESIIRRSDTLEQEVSVHVRCGWCRVAAAAVSSCQPYPQQRLLQTLQRFLCHVQKKSNDGNGCNNLLVADTSNKVRQVLRLMVHPMALPFYVPPWTPAASDSFSTWDKMAAREHVQPIAAREHVQPIQQDSKTELHHPPMLSSVPNKKTSPLLNPKEGSFVERNFCLPDEKKKLQAQPPSQLARVPPATVDGLLFPEICLDF